MGILNIVESLVVGPNQLCFLLSLQLERVNKRCPSNSSSSIQFALHPDPGERKQSYHCLALARTQDIIQDGRFGVGKAIVAPSSTVFYISTSIGA